MRGFRYGGSYVLKVCDTFFKAAKVLAEFAANHFRCLSVNHSLHSLRHQLATALYCHYNLQERGGIGLMKRLL